MRPQLGKGLYRRISHTFDQEGHQYDVSTLSIQLYQKMLEEAHLVPEVILRQEGNQDYVVNAMLTQLAIEEEKLCHRFNRDWATLSQVTPDVVIPLTIAEGYVVLDLEQIDLEDSSCRLYLGYSHDQTLVYLFVQNGYVGIYSQSPLKIIGGETQEINSLFVQCASKLLYASTLGGKEYSTFHSNETVISPDEDEVSFNKLSIFSQQGCELRGKILCQSGSIYAGNLSQRAKLRTKNDCTIIAESVVNEGHLTAGDTLKLMSLDWMDGPDALLYSIAIHIGTKFYQQNGVLISNVFHCNSIDGFFYGWLFVDELAKVNISTLKINPQSGVYLDGRDLIYSKTQIDNSGCIVHTPVIRVGDYTLIAPLKLKPRQLIGSGLKFLCIDDHMKQVNSEARNFGGPGREASRRERLHKNKVREMVLKSDRDMQTSGYITVTAPHFQIDVSESLKLSGHLKAISLMPNARVFMRAAEIDLQDEQTFIPDTISSSSRNTRVASNITASRSLQLQLDNLIQETGAKIHANRFAVKSYNKVHLKKKSIVMVVEDVVIQCRKAWISNTIKSGSTYIEALKHILLKFALIDSGTQSYLAPIIAGLARFKYKKSMRVQSGLCAMGAIRTGGAYQSNSLINLGLTLALQTNINKPSMGMIALGVWMFAATAIQLTVPGLGTAASVLEFVPMALMRLVTIRNMSKAAKRAFVGNADAAKSVRRLQRMLMIEQILVFAVTSVSLGMFGFNLVKGIVADPSLGIEKIDIPNVPEFTGSNPLQWYEFYQSPTFRVLATEAASTALFVLSGNVSSSIIRANFGLEANISSVEHSFLSTGFNVTAAVTKTQYDLLQAGVDINATVGSSNHVGGAFAGIPMGASLVGANSFREQHFELLSPIPTGNYHLQVQADTTNLRGNNTLYESSLKATDLTMRGENHLIRSTVDTTDLSINGEAQVKQSVVRTDNLATHGETCFQQSSVKATQASVSSQSTLSAASTQFVSERVQDNGQFAVTNGSDSRVDQLQGSGLHRAENSREVVGHNSVAATQIKHSNVAIQQQNNFSELRAEQAQVDITQLDINPGATVATSHGTQFSTQQLRNQGTIKLDETLANLDAVENQGRLTASNSQFHAQQYHNHDQATTTLQTTQAQFGAVANQGHFTASQSQIKAMNYGNSGKTNLDQSDVYVPVYQNNATGETVERQSEYQFGEVQNAGKMEAVCSHGSVDTLHVAERGLYAQDGGSSTLHKVKVEQGAALAFRSTTVVADYLKENGFFELDDSILQTLGHNDHILQAAQQDLANNLLFTQGISPMLEDFAPENFNDAGLHFGSDAVLSMQGSVLDDVHVNQHGQVDIYSIKTPLSGFAQEAHFIADIPKDGNTVIFKSDSGMQLTGTKASLLPLAYKAQNLQVEGLLVTTSSLSLLAKNKINFHLATVFSAGELNVLAGGQVISVGAHVGAHLGLMVMGRQGVETQAYIVIEKESYSSWFGLRHHTETHTSIANGSLFSVAGVVQIRAPEGAAHLAGVNVQGQQGVDIAARDAVTLEGTKGSDTAEHEGYRFPLKHNSTHEKHEFYEPSMITSQGVIRVSSQQDDVKAAGVLFRTPATLSIEGKNVVLTREKLSMIFDSYSIGFSVAVAGFSTDLLVEQGQSSLSNMFLAHEPLAALAMQLKGAERGSERSRAGMSMGIEGINLVGHIINGVNKENLGAEFLSRYQLGGAKGFSPTFDVRFSVESTQVMHETLGPGGALVGHMVVDAEENIRIENAYWVIAEKGEWRAQKVDIAGAALSQSSNAFQAGATASYQGHIVGGGMDYMRQQGRATSYVMGMNEFGEFKIAADELNIHSAVMHAEKVSGHVERVNVASQQATSHASGTSQSFSTGGAATFSNSQASSRKVEQQSEFTTQDQTNFNARSLNTVGAKSNVGAEHRNDTSLYDEAHRTSFGISGRVPLPASSSDLLYPAQMHYDHSSTQADVDQNGYHQQKDHETHVAAVLPMVNKEGVQQLKDSFAESKTQPGIVPGLDKKPEKPEELENLNEQVDENTLRPLPVLEKKESNDSYMMEHLQLYWEVSSVEQLYTQGRLSLEDYGHIIEASKNGLGAFYSAIHRTYTGIAEQRVTQSGSTSIPHNLMIANTYSKIADQDHFNFWFVLATYASTEVGKTLKAVEGGGYFVDHINDDPGWAKHVDYGLDEGQQAIFNNMLSSYLIYKDFGITTMQHMADADPTMMCPTLVRGYEQIHQLESAANEIAQQSNLDYRSDFVWQLLMSDQENVERLKQSTYLLALHEQTHIVQPTWETAHQHPHTLQQDITEQLIPGKVDESIEKFTQKHISESLREYIPRFIPKVQVCHDSNRVDFTDVHSRVKTMIRSIDPLAQCAVEPGGMELLRQQRHERVTLLASGVDQMVRGLMNGRAPHSELFEYPGASNPKQGMPSEFNSSTKSFTK